MWFTENAWPPMLIAGLSALIFLGVWNSDRRNRYLFLALGCLALIGVFFVAERAIVTEGERLQADANLLCDQFRRRDRAVLDHFSETATTFRGMCLVAMEMVRVGDDFHTSDFHTTFTNNRSRVDVHFRANGTFAIMGFDGAYPLRCILTYQREGGQWKIVDVQRLDPISGKRIEIMSPR